MNTVRKRFVIFWAMVSMLAMFSGCAEASTADPPTQVPTTQPKTESALASVNRTYAALLKDIVTPDGLVRYDVLGESPRRRSLQEIVAVYAKADLPSGDDEKLAFLCNAYNVNVLKMVVGEAAKEDFTSVMDLPGFFDTLSITVAGQQMTLNELENDHIRPLGDPRIHAALVCAAMSCPPLRGEPYTAKRLDEQLNDQSRRWINNPNQNGIDEQGLGVSMIMQWYGDDFSVEPTAAWSDSSGHSPNRRARSDGCFPVKTTRKYTS